MKSSKHPSVFSNFMWRLAERTGAQMVGFIVSVVLARLLEPSDYGTVALVTVFTTIMQVFVDSGLGNALIQKKDADIIDFSTVFYINCFFCVLLYGVVFLFSPEIARFYNEPSMISYIRVLGITILISGLKNIQQAYVARQMIFRRFFFATLCGTIFSGIIGIILAYEHFGVWALIAQNLTNTLIDTAILWITVKWRPSREFSIERLKGLFHYGWKLLVSSLLDTGYNNLRQLIIGKLYVSTDLAYYNQGNRIPSLVVNNIDTSMSSVLFPTMSREQDNRCRVKMMTRRAIMMSTYLMAPIMMGFAFAAEPLIRLVLTEKWLPCVPYLRIFCVTYIFWPIHTANLNAIKAMGHSDMFLKLEILKKTVGLILLFITMNISVLAMAFSMLLSSISSQIINSWPNRRLIDYTLSEQLRDILPSVGLATGMGIIVHQIEKFGFVDSLTLTLEIGLGLLIYLIGSKALKFETYGYMTTIFAELIHTKKEKRH